MGDDVGRFRFCDGVGCAEGDFGSADASEAYAAFLCDLVPPFFEAEYDFLVVLRFFTGVLLGGAIVQKISRARWVRTSPVENSER